MEYKTFFGQAKIIDGRMVTGMAAVTGNVDSGGDRIFKGAFKKTITENGARVKHLWMHDPYQPPTAVIKALDEVGKRDLPEAIRDQFPEATGGLMVTREYLETPRGEEILAGIKAGAISEMSFGYDPVKFDYEEVREGESKGGMIRNLREVRLWDVSDVTWGMNAATVASKLTIAPMLPAFQEHMPEEQYSLLEDLVNTVQDALDPDVLKTGRVLSARNLERLKTALDTLNDVLLAAEPLEEEDFSALTEQLKVRLALAVEWDQYYWR